MEHMNPFTLLSKRRFVPFFSTQFLGAFNDNLFKNALIIFIAFQAVQQTGQSNTLINLAAGLFILPFFLFSALAGQLADKFDKTKLIHNVKFMEIVIMIGGALGFYLNQPYLLIGILFLMGTQSAFFSPVKYSMLPQHLRSDELVSGNGLIEMGTFLAILTGTICGGVLIGLEEAGKLLVAVSVIVIAMLGYGVSKTIPASPSSIPNLKINWNPFSELWKTFVQVKRTGGILKPILGVAWFWFLGSVLLTQLPNYTRLILGGNERIVTFFLTLFSLSIGIGSLLCARISGKRLETGLIPLGAIGLSIFVFDLYVAQPVAASVKIESLRQFLTISSHWRIIFDMFMIGIFGGLYIVPLFTLIQKLTPKAYRSRIIAGNNILNAFFMVISNGVTILLLGSGVSIPQLFLMMGIASALVTIYIVATTYENFIRLLNKALMRISYRIRVNGVEHIPAEGPALLVCNHTSFVDALLIAACVGRPVRFVMDNRIYNLPVLNRFFRMMKVIPIAPSKVNPQILKQAYEKITEELEAGELVCIFPEGMITYDGELNPFRKGFLDIVERFPTVVVPMALRGMWGSFFSRKNGPAMRKKPQRFHSQVELRVGEPLPPNTLDIDSVQTMVQQLRGEWK